MGSRSALGRRLPGLGTHLRFGSNPLYGSGQARTKSWAGAENLPNVVNHGRVPGQGVPLIGIILRESMRDT